MSALTDQSFVEQLIALLTETYLRPNPGGYYTDKGLTQSLADLNAEQAATIIGDTSIAQHVSHAAFSARASAAWISGDHTHLDWQGSWKLRAPDPAAWQALQSDLGASFAELEAALREHACDSDDCIGASIGAVAHQAYHLGAIRQKLTLLK